MQNNHRGLIIVHTGDGKGKTTAAFGMALRIDFGLVKASAVCRILEKKLSNLHVVLTGRNAPEQILRMADLVTEMKAVKHPYRNGVSAQIGVEF